MNAQMKFNFAQSKYEFGGDLLKRAKNRHARPISSKDPIHLVLKSSRAIGRQSFGHSRNLREVKSLIDKHCSKYGVKLIMYSNNFNHLHLLLKFASRGLYLRFIRTLTSALSIFMTGAKKSSRALAKFFDRRPFTRIVRGWKPYKIVQDYIRLNQLEAAGVIPYQEKRLRDLGDVERAFF